MKEIGDAEKSICRKFWIAEMKPDCIDQSVRDGGHSRFISHNFNLEDRKTNEGEEWRVRPVKFHTSQRSLRLITCLASTIIFCGLVLGQTTEIGAVSSVETILDGSFRAMYNLQFDEALQKAEAAKTVDKEDPLPWLAGACAVLFREFDRLHILQSEIFTSDEKFASRSAYHWEPENKKQFDDMLNMAEQMARQRLQREPQDLKGLFVIGLANGLRADDIALISKQNSNALGYIKTANAYSDKLLNLAPDYYDAYLGTGLGKYIIGSKSAPVRWILRLGGFKGDRAQGLKEITMTAERGRFLAPFAQILLAFDDMRQKHKADAKKKLEALHEQFPLNHLFVEEIAKCDLSVTRPGQ